MLIFKIPLLISDSAWDGMKHLAIKHLACFWLGLAPSKLSFSSLAWASLAERRVAEFLMACSAPWLLIADSALRARIFKKKINKKSLDARLQKSHLGRAGMRQFTRLPWPFTPPACNISNEPSWARCFLGGAFLADMVSFSPFCGAECQYLL